MRMRPGVIAAAAIGLVFVLACAGSRRSRRPPPSSSTRPSIQEIRLSVNSRDLADAPRELPS